LAVTELSAPDAFGGLGCLPPVSEQVVENFMKCQGYSLDIFKVLKYYFSNTNFYSITEDDSQCAWYQLIGKTLNSINILVLLLRLILDQMVTHKEEQVTNFLLHTKLHLT